MSQKERNEWIERAKERVLRNAKETDTYARNIMDLYDETANQLENEINAMLQKYAQDNKLDNAEAEKLLSSEEYSRWRKSMDKYVAETQTDSRTLLELNTLSAKSRISRKEQLLSQIYLQMINLAGDTETKLTDLLSDMFKTNYYRSCYDIQSIMGVGFTVAKVDEKMLKRILEFPWSGKNYSQALWEDTDKLAALARRELTMGFMSGASVQKMAKSIDDVMHRGRKNAERLVRTESSYFSNQGQMQSYQELGIEEYIFLGGGCEMCQALNGQAFKLSEAEAGVNLPPIHPNCKCTTRAKPRIDMFALKDGANPLKDNPKFEEWKKRYVKEKAKEPVEPLTDAEQHAMNSYISSSSYVWNDKLRRGEKLTKQEEQSIKAMDSALQKMPKYEGTVKRSLSDFGIPDVDEFVKSYVPGELKIFNEYLSSSTEVYDDSFQIQYVIQSKNGRDIRKYNSTEKEILFERGASFIVTRVDGHTIYMEEL